MHARVVDGRVAEIIPAGPVPLAERFHPEVVATMVAVGAEVAVGWLWDGAAWSPPPPPSPAHEAMAAQARAERDRRLRESDWVDLIGAAERLGKARSEAWARYRAALRDVPAQDGFPAKITWPEMPA